MEFSVENVCGLLIRSKLLNPDGVKAMYQRWQGDAGEQGGNLGQFTRWLVANQYVTEYQATLVAKGHADDFFVNQYKILDRLGRGRNAGVYKAVHQVGQIVAIKILPPSKSKNPQLLGRFLRESRLALRLKHPNVVRSFQTGQYKGLRYVVMEYLEGETLDAVLQRRKRLPPGEAVRLIHQALVGLQHIHEQGLIHRDLKPANLILVPAPPSPSPLPPASGGEGRVRGVPGPGEPDTTQRATVKILDIGLGRTPLGEEPASLEDSHLTGEVVLLGTPDYLAPEQARDPHGVDIRADIYSLGCVLYHALTGEPPFPDTNLLSQMVRHATETPRPLKELNPALPDGLQQIVNGMLAKDPAQRYPTPQRAVQALQVFLTAGNEPERLPEDGPQLRKYLTWLEINNNDQEAQPEAARSGVARQAPRGHAAKKHRRQQHASPSAKVVSIPEAPARLEDFDVELVPALAPPARPLFRLTLREWLLVAVGSGATLAAIVIGMLLARLFPP